MSPAQRLATGDRRTPREPQRNSSGTPDRRCEASTSATSRPFICPTLQLPDCQIVTRECADENSPGFEPGYFIPTPLLVFILTCPTAYRRTDLHEALHPARTKSSPQRGHAPAFCGSWQVGVVTRQVNALSRHRRGRAFLQRSGGALGKQVCRGYASPDFQHKIGAPPTSPRASTAAAFRLSAYSCLGTI